MKPTDVIKVQRDGAQIDVTRKAFDSYYAYAGYEEVKTAPKRQVKKED